MSDIQIIKDKLDLVDFVSEYVRLKPAGVNHKGLCPFHNENTPSFMVSRERQSFKCFGCGKGGDIFTFVEETEGLSFVEALKFLADKSGVALTRQVNEVQANQKNRLKDIVLEAARFYHNFLLQMKEAEIARKYLTERGLSAETIEIWQIGFIPEQWDLLTKYLLKKGYSIDDLVAAGITIKRENASPQTMKGFYDRFRGRIMFPIRDVHGTVVGFTGRVLVETERSGGKYVNTPQSIIYDKSRIVFGLDNAKRAIKQADFIVMVEGQVDVIACHQAGMKNVVATSGTALTEMQVQLLKRYSQNMSMAFDADEAGQKAAKRGIDIALAEGMRVSVIQIPEGKGKDPDACVRDHPDAWAGAVQNAKEVMNWYFDKAFVGKDLTSARDKQFVVDEILLEIARIPYAVERDHWIRELGGKLGVDLAVLREDMVRLSDHREEKYAGAKKKENWGQSALEKRDRLPQLIERFFALFVQFPNSLVPYVLRLTPQQLSTSPYLSLYEAIQKGYTTNHSVDIAFLRSELAVNNPTLVDSLFMYTEWEFSFIEALEAEKEAEILIINIVNEWKKDRRQDIQIKLQFAEQKGDTAQMDVLLREFRDL